MAFEPTGKDCQPRTERERQNYQQDCARLRTPVELTLRFACAMLNLVVNLSEQHLSRTFSALSDATRRALIARLVAEGSLSVSALAEPFSMSLPAVMKHLDHLAGAGLVARSKQGRVVSYKLTPAPIGKAMRWLEQHQSFWTGSLDKLEARVKARTLGKRKGTR